MGLVHTIANADFSAIRRGIRLAVPGASALHVFGGTLAASAVNYAGDRVAGSWVGAAPTPEAGYVPINGGASGMDTGVTETGEVTILMVVRSPVISVPAATSSYFINTNTGTASVGGATINGCSLFVNNPSDGRWTWSITRHDGAGNNSLITRNLTGANIPPQNSWTLVACRADATRQGIQDLTRSKADSTTSALARNPTTTTWRVGTRKATFASIGQADVHSAIIYPSYLSDADLALVAAQMRAIAAQKGITV